MKSDTVFLLTHETLWRESDTLMLVQFVTSVMGLAINLLYVFHFLSILRKRLLLLHYCTPNIDIPHFTIQRSKFLDKNLIKDRHILFT